MRCGDVARTPSLSWATSKRPSHICHLQRPTRCNVGHRPIQHTEGGLRSTTFIGDKRLLSSTSRDQPVHIRVPKEISRTLSSLGASSILAAASSLAIAWPALADSLVSIPGVVGDDPFREGVVSGFLLIFFSELGDKTFFIALLLALKKNRVSVFAGTFGALAIMTLISVGLGQALHQIDELLPADARKIPYDDVFAAALLVFFGVKTLQEAKDANESAQEEREEAQEEVDRFAAGGDLGLILSTFTLIFAAEWGDKSFLATIALSAASSPAGVVTGAVAGHGVATALAVAGGSVLSKYVDERLLQYVGGSLFLVFAGATVFDIFVQHPDLMMESAAAAAAAAAGASLGPLS